MSVYTEYSISKRTEDDSLLALGDDDADVEATVVAGGAEAIEYASSSSSGPIASPRAATTYLSVVLDRRPYRPTKT
jgi:hypothetical protein